MGNALNIAPADERRKVRVLFVDHTAQMGGGEIALLNLVNQFDGTQYQPVVVLFGVGPLRAKLEELGVETHVLNTSGSLVSARKDELGLSAMLRLGDAFAMVAIVLKLRTMIRGLNVDLVHTNSLKADIIGGLAGRLASKWVIWHVRDRIATDYLPPKIVKLFRLLSRIIPQVVVCNSDATLRTLFESATPRRIVIHDGTILPEATANSGDAPADVGQSPTEEASQLQIGLVGRISPWKGQDVFLKAAAEVHRRFPQARFQIIGAPLFGEADYEQKLHGLVTELNLSDVVEFTGFRSDVLGLIGSLDLLVHASTSAEPFGQVVIEAMAAGKPVVATNGGGVPEIVVDGVTGLLVPMGESQPMAVAIESLLADPEYAAEMGRRGRQRVIEQFTIARTARKVQELYDQLLGRVVDSGWESQTADLKQPPPRSGTT